MLIGGKMAEGATMYRDLYDGMGPLSAGVYGILDSLFGRSVTAYRVLAIALVFTQCCIFAISGVLNKAYKENNYASGLVMMTLFCSFFQYMSLTPMLMANTFLILATHFSMNHVMSRQGEDSQILTVGIMAGLASLFYWPALLFLAGLEIVMVFLTNSVFRRYVLLIAGAALPLGFCAVYYLWHDGLHNLLNQGILSILHNRTAPLVNHTSVWAVCAIPLLLFFRALPALWGGRGFNYRHMSYGYAMLITAATALAVYFISPYRSPSNLIFVIGPAAFFITHYLLEIRKRFVTEIVFGFFIVLILGFNYTVALTPNIWAEYVDLSQLTIPKPTGLENGEAEKTLVLGPNFRLYGNGELATPFLDWRFTKPIFEELDDYGNLLLIHQAFENDPPKKIIDQENVMPKLLEKIPEFQQRYRKAGEGTYILIL
ncbi:hypothetical protein FUAX_00980 [Fulvitalea axinellae]|uniref:Glycosyltransferase RgtA/B/C/D-like domain-containing protein n=2 Tax=Fulvitalea axinellae TaxID=1182444 RepID=A0AAU9CFX6_9BACT|nr:hypothetical protein FUAX_00980 [Fulvitalea axinellae]